MPPNPYRTVSSWGALPKERAWGPVSAVATDRDGASVWVAERCGAGDCAASPLNPILKFDRNGALVTSFGAGLFVVPHGMDVDPDGNVWVTDAPDGTLTGAGKGRQVLQVQPGGKAVALARQGRGGRGQP